MFINGFVCHQEEKNACNRMLLQKKWHILLMFIYLFVYLHVCVCVKRKEECGLLGGVFFYKLSVCACVSCFLCVFMLVFVCVCVLVGRRPGVYAEWEVCAEFRAVHSKLQLGARPPIMKLQVGALTYNLDHSTL